jgi:hypothetical protein
MPYFGTNVDGQEQASRVYQDVVVGVDTKGGEEVGGVVVEIVDVRDEVEEVSIYVLFL